MRLDLTRPKGPLLIALLGLLALSGTASAQRATLTQDTESDARSPYQEGIFHSCPYAGDCAMLFSPVAAGKRRVIEYVSCVFAVTGGAGVQTVSLNSQGFRNARGFFQIQSSAYAPGTFIVNSPTLLYFNAGEIPRIDAYTSGGTVSDAVCTLTGREITL